MKVRLSFVTNSSSTSFVVFGTYVSNLGNKFVTEDRYGDETVTKELEEIIKSPLSVGGQYEQKVGIEVDTLFAKYKDIKISDVQKLVADEINKQFSTNLTEKDIFLFQEGWYDG
jgi:hypothetical protein